MLAMGYMIEARGLVKRFGDVEALAGLDLTAEAGQVFAILGPNGAGKTTFIRAIATLTKFDEGTLTVAGIDVAKHPKQVRRAIGLAGQYAAVDESLTGTENLLMLGRLLGASRPAARQRAAELLDRFGLTDAAGRATKTYSGGMRRRLDLTRASWAARKCSSSTSRPPVWIPAVVVTCGTSCAGSSRTE